ncbi:GNAT family N-acetyltransferase [bacterium]|nr:GNAT family N-acetyltransferase [bacterium]
MLSSNGVEPFSIRTMLPKEAAECETVMRSLPGWFGIEKSIQQYRRDIEVMETCVVMAGGRIVGFMVLNQHNQFSAEIHVMGVLEEFHRRGIGRSLVERAVDVLRGRSLEYLQVKTLGPSRENEAYAGTRRTTCGPAWRTLMCARTSSAEPAERSR